MKIIIQAFWILFFYLLGMGVSLFIGGLIPGSVLGMLFLFVSLSMGWLKEERVAGVAQILINNMMFFFLPATVGLIVAADLVSRNFVAITIATIVSTILVLVAVGLFYQKMEQRRQNGAK